MIDDFCQCDSMKSKEMTRMKIRVEHQVQYSSDELEKRKWQIEWVEIHWSAPISLFLSFFCISDVFLLFFFCCCFLWFFFFLHWVPILSGNVCYRVVSRGQYPFDIFLFEGVNEWIMKRWESERRRRREKKERQYKIQFLIQAHRHSSSMWMRVSLSIAHVLLFLRCNNIRHGYNSSVEKSLTSGNTQLWSPY